MFFAAVTAAQTPAAGTISAVPASGRIGSSGQSDNVNPIPPSFGIYNGMCAKWAKQNRAQGDGLVNNTTQAAALLDGQVGSQGATLEPIAGDQSATGRRGRFFDRAPQIDYQNQTGDGLHSPSFFMPWDNAACRLQGTVGTQGVGTGVQSLGAKFAVRMRGNIHIPTAGTHTFVIRSDDGYSLKIGGVTIAAYEFNRGPSIDSRRASFATPGVYPIEVVFWDQGGIAALEIFIKEGNFCFPGNVNSFAACSGAATDLSNAGDIAPSAAFRTAFDILDYRRLDLPTWVTASADPAFTAADEKCLVNQASVTCGPPKAQACGNGIRETVNTAVPITNTPMFVEEGCDDGNLVNGDGCNSTCELEPGFFCGTGPFSVCGANPPTMSTPANGSAINTNNPPYTGTVVPVAVASVLKVFVDGALACTVAVPANASTFSCTIPGQALSEGSHSVRAIVEVGTKVSQPSSTNTFVVDTVVPNTVIDSNPPLISNLSTGSFTFSSPGEANPTFECSLDGAMFVACPASYTTGMLMDGSHTLLVRALDPAGNVDPTPASYTWTIDTVAPAAPVISAPVDGSSTASTTPTISGSCETGALVTVTTGTTTLCSNVVCTASAFSCVSTPLTGGTYPLVATQTDPAGNVSGPSTTVNVTIDTAAPDTNIITGPPAITNAGTATFTFTGTKVGSTFECRVDGGAFAACTSPFTTAMLMDGSHTFEVRAIDTAGNVDPTPAIQTWVIDRVVPDTSIVTKPPLVSTSPTNAFTFDSTKMGVAYECRIYDVTAAMPPMFVACPQAYTTSALPDGKYTLEVRAVDAAGNIDPSPDSYTFTVDVSPPETTIATGPDAVVNTPTSAFTFTSDDAAATFECSIDGAAYSACPASYTSPSLPDGSHTLSVRAVDAAGNVDPSPATRTWVIDTNPPETVIATGPAEGSTVASSNVTFTFTSPEAGVTFECKVDGGAFAACPATFTLSGLAMGPHSLEVRAKDAAGNVDPSPATRKWTVALPPGQPTVELPADNSVTSNPLPVVSGTAPAGSTVKVFVDGATAPTCTATADAMGKYSCPLTVPLADGPHTVNAVASEPGKPDSSPSATNNFTVDTKAPTVVWTAPVANTVLTDNTPTLTGSSEPGATVTVFLDSNATPLCTVLVPASGVFSCTPAGSLAEGPHTATAQAKDAAGNVSPVAVLPFSIDSAGPVAPIIVAPAEGATTSPTPTLSGTAEPFTTVVVTGTAGTLCTAVTDAVGNWTCVVTTALPVGAQTAVATATDAAGNASPASPVRNFIVAADAPIGPPVLTSPSAGSFTKDSTPTISGTAAPGSTVDVFIDGVKVCTDVIVSSTGAFTCEAMPALADGPHVATATATLGGKTSAPSTQVPFTVDTKAPTAPVVVKPADTSTTNNLPVYAGTAEPGSTVKVTVDDSPTPVCQAVADATGNWTCAQLSPLADGVHKVNAKSTDSAGNESAVSNTNNFTVAGPKPLSAPVIERPAPGSITNDKTPVYSGTASPGLTVKVFVDGGTTPVCTVVADAGGKWSCTGTMPLTDGPHTVKATASDAVDTSVDSNTNPFTVDTVGPNVPTVVAPANGSITGTKPAVFGTAEPGSTVTVRIDGQVVCVVQATAASNYSCTLTSPLAMGPHTVTAQATDAAGNEGPASVPNSFTVDMRVNVPIISVPASGAFVGDSKPTFSGTAEPGAQVSVYVDGSSTPVCTVKADDMGKWSCVSTVVLTPGPHVATADATVGGMKSGLSAPVDFVIATTTVTSPAAGSTVTTQTPTYEGAAAPGSSVTVSVDGAEVCTVIANPMGLWSCKPTAPVLSVGSHTVRAVATVGGVAVPSTENPFIVAPVLATPVITSPTAGEKTGPRPVIAGTGTPGSTVTVTVDDQAACTTTVDANGKWSCPAVGPLSPGDHTVKAVASDAAGNKSGEASVVFNVAADDGFYSGAGVCSAGPSSAVLWLGLLMVAALFRRRAAVQ